MVPLVEQGYALHVIPCCRGHTGVGLRSRASSLLSAQGGLLVCALAGSPVIPAADSRPVGTHRERKADSEATHTGGDRPLRTSLPAGKRAPPQASGHSAREEQTGRRRARGGDAEPSQNERGRVGRQAFLRAHGHNCCAARLR